MQINLQCPDSPLVQSLASASARALKIPNSDSNIPLFRHTHSLLHTLIGMGSAALAAVVALRVRPLVFVFTQRINNKLKK